MSSAGFRFGDAQACSGLEGGPVQKGKSIWHALRADCSPGCVAAVLDDPGPLENTREGVMGRVHAGTFVTHRAESCKRLFNIMSRMGVVLIKAPPCTGKTSQLQLLKRWLRARPSHLEVVHISFLTLTARDDVVNFIERHANCSWQDITACAERRIPSTQRWAASQWQRRPACWYWCCEPVKGFCEEAAHPAL